MHTKFIIMKRKEEARSGKKDNELSLTSNNIVVIYSDLRKVVITSFAIKCMLLYEQNVQPQLYYNYPLYNNIMSLALNVLQHQYNIQNRPEID